VSAQPADGQGEPAQGAAPGAGAEPEEAKPPRGEGQEGQEPEGRGAGGAVGDRYAERDRAVVASVYIHEDHRSYGVYAEGTIRARDIAGHDKTAGDGAGQGGERQRPVSVLPVAAQDRERLRRVMVSSGHREHAAEMLARKRLVVLHGPDGVGKASAGLWLLGLDQEVLSIDPSVTARDLAELGRRLPYGKGRRYLVDALAPATASRLTSFVMRAAARDLAAGDGYLVITVDDRVPLGPDLADFTVPWPERPDTALALRAHLEYYLPGGEAAAAEERYELAQVRTGLAARALRLVDDAARVVERGFRDGRPLEAVLADLGFGAQARAGEWFGADGGRSPGEIGFLLAAAVLHGVPYSTAARHAGALERLIAGASRIRLSRQPAEPLRGRSARLAGAMAVLEPGFIETEYGKSPADMVRLESPWLVPAVLGTVWQEYDLVSDALLAWLRAAGDDPDPDVRLRAAAAAGWLSQYDFAGLRAELFLPWAKGSSRAAWSAADALGQAAWLAGTAPLALALLDVWAGQDEDYDLWWTAAVAYGGDAGVAYPSVALDHLLAIAEKDDPRARHVVAGSLVRLVGAGGRFIPELAAFVLAGLADWLEQGPAAAAAALDGYTEVLRRAADPDWPSSREYWRRLAAPQALGSSARLLRAALGSRAARDEALGSVEVLARAGDGDPLLLAELEALLAGVTAAGGTDRDRIVHYLSRWAAGYDPSPGARELADRLKGATAP
jgi:hypothetical protein